MTNPNPRSPGDGEARRLAGPRQSGEAGEAATACGSRCSTEALALVLIAAVVGFVVLVVTVVILFGDPTRRRPAGLVAVEARDAARPPQMAREIAEHVANEYKLNNEGHASRRGRRRPPDGHEPARTRSRSRTIAVRDSAE